MLKPTFALTLTATCISLMLAGCNDSNKPAKVVVTPPAPVVLSDIGMWSKPGYGEVFQFTKDTLSYYQYNNMGCTLLLESTRDVALEHFIESLTVKDTEHVLLQEKGNLDKLTLERIDALPQSCDTPIIAERTASKTQVFDYFWHTFNDYYAFFELRGVDWQAAYTTYRPMVSEDMSEDELFDVIEAMLALLNDRHINLTSEDMDRTYTAGAPIYFERAALGLSTASLGDDEYLSPDEAEQNLRALYSQVSASYLTPNSVKRFPDSVGTETVLWGKTPDNVGVIVLNNFFLFAEQYEGEIKTVEAVNKLFNTVMGDLADTKGIVIDVRNNIGGHDSAALAIANLFTSQPKTVFYKQARNKSGSSDITERTLPGTPTAYTNPVYVLTSHSTISAGESFVIAMSQLPQVTTVGKNTSGALSDVHVMQLPNGWMVSLSNEVYWTPNNELFEMVGVTPDIEMAPHSIDSLKTGHFASYDYALAQLGRTAIETLSQVEFETQIKAISAQANINNLALSIVKGDKVVYQQGFGVNERTGEHTTADSQFYLGSVSKTLLGATIAGAVYDKKATLDTPVQSVLPSSFQIAQDSTENPITLRQLMTHTAGILDNQDTYACSYFLYENYVSLASLLAPKLGCNSIVDSDISAFLNGYLNVNGQYYSAENNLAQFGLANNQAYVYSNIGSALAAYVLEQQTGESLASLSQRYVFEPLNMPNTLWATSVPVGVTPRYITDDQGQPMMLPEYRNVTYADGMAVSSSADLARYLIALNTKSKLNPSVVDSLLSAQTPIPTAEGDISYFWQLDGDLALHTGSDPGVTTQILLDTRQQSGYVLLTNADSDNEATLASFEQLNQLVRRFAEQQ